MAIDKQIKDLQNRIDAIEQSDRLLDRKLSDFTSQLKLSQAQDADTHKELVQELSHLDRQITNVLSRSYNQLDELTSSSENLDTLATELISISSSVQTVQSDISGIGSNVGQAITEMASLNSGLTSVSGDVSSIQDGITNIDQGVDGIRQRVSAVEITAASTSNLVSEVQQNMSSLGETLTTHSSSISSLNNKVTSHTSQLTNLDTRLDTVESDRAQFESQISELSETQNSIQSEVDSIGNSVNQHSDILSQFTESLAPETLIDTQYGKIQIGDLAPGARIWRPTGYGRLTLMTLETVLETPRRVPQNEPLYRITLCDGSTFIATKHHTFAVLSGNELHLTRVRDLAIGTPILTYKRIWRLGIRQTLSVVKIEPVNDVEEVCNLTLPHRQFLIEGGILSH